MRIVEAVVRFEVDEQGDVLRSLSPARPYDIAGGYAEAPWTCEFSDHQKLGGMRIPEAVVARFEKDDRGAAIGFLTSLPCAG